ncbi:hypothetical protein BDZ89DRAFT_1082362 [Hymenopellis radicata]|nr:hypothetical protein BDZ89DRAFT_1082362 [Hymenopellis radicata]
MACARCAPFPNVAFTMNATWKHPPSSPSSYYQLSATDQEASHIQKTILPSIEADISSMTAKVADLQVMLHSMEQERDALEAVHKQYRNLIHPHRAVPPELWSEIFLFAIFGQIELDEDFDACDSSGPIWALSQVCRPWRDIALSLHSLWSKIIVDLTPSAGKVRILELVLQRTGQHSLDVTLGNADVLDRARRSSDIHSLLTLKDQVVGMAFAESHRWRTLEILEYADSDILYAPLCDRLPRLESLSLYFSYDPTLGAEAQPVNPAFKDCPRLTKVALVGKRRSINLPYARITDLYIQNDWEPLLHEDCLAYIRLVGQCTSLKKLRIIGHSNSDPSFLSAPLIPPLMIHSNLRKLITGCDHIIDHLTLPQLEEAILSKERDREYANILPSFDRLLRRSHCTSLTKLNIIDLTSIDRLIISVLSQTPNLTTVGLRTSMAADGDASNPQAMQAATEFIQALQVRPQQTVTFLPRVSSVKIHLIEHMDSSEIPYFGPRGSFSSMVRARWAGDAKRGLAKLEKFHFGLSAGLLGSPYHDTTGRLPHLANEVEAHILSRLVHDGMDLVIRVIAILDPRGLDSTDILAVGG